jgi:hypothetical protein
MYAASEGREEQRRHHDESRHRRLRYVVRRDDARTCQMKHL